MSYRLVLNDGTYAVVDDKKHILTRHVDRKSAFDAALQRIAEDHGWRNVPGSGYRDAEGRSVPFERFEAHIEVRA